MTFNRIYCYTRRWKEWGWKGGWTAVSTFKFTRTMYIVRVSWRATTAMKEMMVISLWIRHVVGLTICCTAARGKMLKKKTRWRSSSSISLISFLSARANNNNIKNFHSLFLFLFAPIFPPCCCWRARRRKEKRQPELSCSFAHHRVSFSLCRKFSLSL